jgi:hypothetical protein
LTDVAQSIGAPSGAAVGYLERLGDAVERTQAGEYRLIDPTFALWLRWRQPGGTVVPMTVVGDEAERRVAEELARMGFDLVYQSRASRGAFDLLALRGGGQLGVQVKRTTLPATFDRPAWSRMVAEGRRLSWRWVIAAVDPGGTVHFLDPARARKGRTVRLGAASTLDNVLTWVDGAA